MKDSATKCYIIMRDGYGWNLYQNHNIKMWFFGCQHSNNINNMMGVVSSMSPKTSIDNEVLDWISNISGHFSVVVETSSWALSVVDKICTVPVFMVKFKNSVFISNHAPVLKEKCMIGCDNLDKFAGLEIAMSGFTIGNKTLYHNLESLESGECMLFSNSSVHKRYYYTYSPWKVNYKNNSHLKEVFTTNLIRELMDLKNSVNGRQIVIPLSAGNDSRLIASGLKNLGVENVVCFSYGRKGNFETPISKNIAKKLGYKWLHLPVNIKEKRIFFKSDVYRKYVEDFESYNSVPNTQEIYEIFLLKENPMIDAAAVIVNGNSGDFISGGHIPLVDNKEKAGISRWNLYLDKHYSSWEVLRTKSSDFYIVSELNKVLLSRSIVPINLKEYSYSIMECLECVGRQSKLVIRQQRAYDYFGYEWRLPLWSDRMLNFWEGVPYEYKIRQKLYIDTICENNWGDVWLDIKVNNKTINPYFLRWVRIFFKIILSVAGRKKWHRFEKNAFEYFMHPSYALTVIPYFRVLFNRNGYRNAKSWLSYKMLKDNGLEGFSWVKKIFNHR
jgi:asparagine synthase (glutamine-hydrolysing)